MAASSNISASRKQSPRSRWRLLLASLVVVACAVAVVLTRPLEVLDCYTRARLWSMGMSSEYTVIEGNRIHFYAGGSGQPVVLIHGLGSRSEDWSDIISILLKSGYRVYAIDLLGYGRSDTPPTAGYSIAQQADLVEHFMADQHLVRAELMGWSMGGWVAADLALKRPDLVDRLILFDSAGTSFHMDFPPTIFNPTSTQDIDALFARILPRPIHIPFFIAHELLDRMQRHGWIVRRSMHSMMTGDDLLDSRIRALRMPVLIVWGKQDHLLPLSAGQALHGMVPQSVLEIYDGCGHLAAAQCARAIGPNMLDFLSAEPPARPGSREIPEDLSWFDRIARAAHIATLRPRAPTSLSGPNRDSSRS